MIEESTEDANGGKHVEICWSSHCWLNLYVTQFNAGDQERYRFSQNNMYLKEMWIYAGQKVDKCTYRDL